MITKCFFEKPESLQLSVVVVAESGSRGSCVWLQPSVSGFHMSPRVSLIGSFCEGKWGEKRTICFGRRWVMKPHFFSLARKGAKKRDDMWYCRDVKSYKFTRFWFCYFQNFCFLADFKKSVLLSLIYNSAKLFVLLLKKTFAYLKGHRISHRLSKWVVRIAADKMSHIWMRMFSNIMNGWTLDELVWLLNRWQQLTT